MKRAVVMGASMTGLLAARVLSGHFDTVDVLERDPDPGDSVVARKGVPQGRHLHVLLRAGEELLERYFPGFVRELHAAGAHEIDQARDVAWFHHGTWKLRQRLGIKLQMASRPLLEATVLRRVRAIDNVNLRYDCAVHSPEWDADARRVRGVRHTPARDRGASPTLLEADLVVDARGRGSQLPLELVDWGFETPPESRVGVDLQYSTRVYRSDPSHSFPWRVLAIYPMGPTWTRGGVLSPLEGDRYVCTLVGYAGDHAPSDVAGFAAFARDLPRPELAEALAALSPETDPILHRFPYARRYHFQRLRRLPKGIVALGDAVCSFDPVFGQGMAAAAIGTQVLDEWLRAGARSERTFFRELARSHELPWTMTCCEDFRFPQVTGARPPGISLLQAYGERVFRACAQYPEVYAQFLRVMHLQDNPFAMIRPGMIRRILFASQGTMRHQIPIARLETPEGEPQ